MLRAVRKLFAWNKPQPGPRISQKDLHERHLAWDRACRARGMTAREQADELQLRCAWVRLRRKASAKVLQKPRRFRDILDRVAMDEAKTLRAIGGGELAGAFLRAYEAAEPLEILSREAALLVRTNSNGALPTIEDAPSIAPESAARRRGEKMDGCGRRRTTA
jgi:hypothetical protein